MRIALDTQHFPDALYQLLLPQAKQGLDDILALHRSGELAFLDDPRQPLADEVAALAASLPPHRAVLVLGIGGSALGVKVLLQGIAPTPNRPDFAVLDTPDPEPLADFMARYRPDEVVVLVISKSGGTSETLAQFQIVWHWLGQHLDGSARRSRVVAITDPKNGPLRQWAQQEGLPSLPVPPAIGGRFSVLTPVGLLPGALAGIAPADILRGARWMADRIQSAPADSNPACLGAALAMAAGGQGHDQHVFMPYHSRLAAFSQWFVQLWAESLGKRRGEERVGFTPIPAVGPTDQHAQVQLFMEGPLDKFLTFIAVEEPHTLAVPDEVVLPGPFGYLAGVPLHRLVTAEHSATAQALAEAGQLNVTWSIPKVDAPHLGALFMLFEGITAVTGQMLAIDAFDQPGVERGKVLTRQRLASGAVDAPPAAHAWEGTASL